uniref:Transposase n=1 Tax=Cyprinus carpio TaxID=7962 RepID=A0A8C2ANV4_CYPCA
NMIKQLQQWVAKNPRVTSKQLMAFLVLANESTIRRTLNNHGVQLVSRRLYKKTIAACLQLAKDHVKWMVRDQPFCTEEWAKAPTSHCT